MTFGEAVRSGFEHYAKFDGRASRPEFWWWVLFVILMGIGANLIDLAIGAPVFSAITGLGLLLPNIAVSIRRLHDTDQRLVDSDLADSADRADRAAGLLPPTGRSRGEPFRASADNDTGYGNDRLIDHRAARVAGS